MTSEQTSDVQRVAQVVVIADWLAERGRVVGMTKAVANVLRNADELRRQQAERHG